MNSINNLKFAVFDEWSDDPPAGTSRYYYVESGESYETFLGTIGEILDHLNECTDDEEDLEGLEEAAEILEKDNLTAEDIIHWGWDNGGVGGECLVFAEGKEIAETAAEFYKEHFIYSFDFDDPYIDVDFDELMEMNDEEEIEIEFYVSISAGDGDGGNVSVDVPVSIKEMKLLINCAVKGIEIAECDELNNLSGRVEEAAADENDWIVEHDLETDEDFCDVKYGISNPIDTGEYNSYTAGYIVRSAKENSEDVEAVGNLINLLYDLAENNNNSMF